MDDTKNEPLTTPSTPSKTQYQEPSILEILEKYQLELQAKNTIIDTIAIIVAVVILLFFFFVLMGKISKRNKVLQDKNKQVKQVVENKEKKE